MLCSRLKEPRILYVGRVWDNHPTDMPMATENLSQTISPIDAGRTYDPCQAIWHLFQHAWCRSHDEGPVVKRVAVLKNEHQPYRYLTLFAFCIAQRLK